MGATSRRPCRWTLLCTRTKQGENIADSESRDTSSALRRQPSAHNLRRLLEDPFTRDVLYPGQFVDGVPPETLEYLADDVTGRPQHSYVLDEAHPHGG